MAKQVPIIDGEQEIPLVRLDRTKPYGTIHGDRTPEDPHYRCHYWQRGLPFDAQGILVPDDGKTQPWTAMGSDGKPIVHQPLYNKDMRAEVERRIARMLRSQKDADAERTTQVPAEEPIDPAEDVNLESYLRGEVDYPFFQLKKACEARFHKKYNRLRTIIEDLVYEEKVIPESQVAPEILRKLDQGDAPAPREAA